MFILGSAIGSFLCCQARRLRLKAGKKAEKKSSAKSTKSAKTADAKTEPKPKSQKSTKSATLGHRSVCLHCRHHLSWYENIPIFSWLFLKGKCKKCHHKIGLLELLAELGTALAFLLISIHFLYATPIATAAPTAATDPVIVTTIDSTLVTTATPNLLADFPTFTPMSWGVFIATILLTISLVFLAIYDGMCGELPIFALTISAICAIILLSLQIGNSFLVTESPDILQIFLLPLSSAALFGGIYLILYIASKGQWVGDGDWILAAIIGLALGHPWLSLITLFLANFLACLVMYPVVKKKKDHHIYFGPFLVIAFIIIYSFSSFFLGFI